MWKDYLLRSGMPAVSSLNLLPEEERRQELEDGLGRVTWYVPFLYLAPGTSLFCTWYVVFFPFLYLVRRAFFIFVNQEKGHLVRPFFVPGTSSIFLFFVDQENGSRE